MKKISSYLVTFALLAVLALQTAPAKAEAESTAPAIGPEEAALMKKSLDVLAVLLVQMQTQIAQPEGLKQAAAYSLALGQIVEKLTAISSSLGPGKVAAVAVREAPKAEPEAKPEIVQPPAVTIAEPEELPPVAAASQPKENGEDSQKGAVVSSTFGGGVWLWVAIGAIAIGAILFWPRRKEEMKVEPVREDAQQTASIEVHQENL